MTLEPFTHPRAAPWLIRVPQPLMEVTNNGSSLSQITPSRRIPKRDGQTGRSIWPRAGGGGTATAKGAGSPQKASPGGGKGEWDESDSSDDDIMLRELRMEVNAEISKLKGVMGTQSATTTPSRSVFAVPESSSDDELGGGEDAAAPQARQYRTPEVRKMLRARAAAGLGAMANSTLAAGQSPSPPSKEALAKAEREKLQREIGRLSAAVATERLRGQQEAAEASKAQGELEAVRRAAGRASEREAGLEKEAREWRDKAETLEGELGELRKALGRMEEGQVQQMEALVRGMAEQELMLKEAAAKEAVLEEELERHGAQLSEKVQRVAAMEREGAEYARRLEGEVGKLRGEVERAKREREAEDAERRRDVEEAVRMERERLEEEGGGQAEVERQMEWRGREEEWNAREVDWRRKDKEFAEREEEWRAKEEEWRAREEELKGEFARAVCRVETSSTAEERVKNACGEDGEPDAVQREEAERRSGEREKGLEEAAKALEAERDEVGRQWEADVARLQAAFSQEKASLGQEMARAERELREVSLVKERLEDEIRAGREELMTSLAELVVERDALAKASEDAGGRVVLLEALLEEVTLQRDSLLLVAGQAGGGGGGAQAVLETLTVERDTFAISAEEWERKCKQSEAVSARAEGEMIALREKLREEEREREIKVIVAVTFVRP